MLQVWTEVCHENFGNWEVWNLHKNEECVQRIVFLWKNVYKLSKHGFVAMSMNQKDSL